MNVFKFPVRLIEEDGFYVLTSPIPPYSIRKMAHLDRDKRKLLARTRRIRGQVDAIEKAIEEARDCAPTLQMLAACRGAINSLMAELVEGHVRFHVLNPDDRPTSPRSRAAQELIDLVKTYLK